MVLLFWSPPKGEARVYRRCTRIDVPFWNVRSRYAYVHRTKKITVLYKALTS